MAEQTLLTAQVPPELEGSRLDAAAAQLFDRFSRSRLKSWIEAGALQLNGAAETRPRQAVRAGDRLALAVTVEPHSSNARPQALALNLVYEDAELAVIDKPPGLIVHPGAGAPDGTLQNALLHRYPAAATLPRAGIVHRLDKDTSGLMVVALTLAAHARLVAALAGREVRREYDAVAAGVLSGGGRIEAPIGRHPRSRTKMAVISSGRAAVSHYRVIERFRHHTHLRVRLETGRTHQIRVHLAHLKHPIVGDPVYAPKGVRGAGLDPALREKLARFPRQALHARELELRHPASGELMRWTTEPPADMQELLKALRRDAKRGA